MNKYELSFREWIGEFIGKLGSLNFETPYREVPE